MLHVGHQRVWIDGYDFGCCGEPFEVGSTVRWDVETTPADSEWLSHVLGNRDAPTIDVYERRHGDEDDVFVALEGKVQRIDAVFCRYGPPPNHGDGLEVVAGSGVLVPRTAAPRFLADNGDLEFIGYVVDLEVIQVTNPPT